MSIEMRELSFFRGDTPIFENLTLTLPNSGAVCLCGPSGCGKSTLLRLLCGLETPTGGTISPEKQFGVVFQYNALLPWRTVEENVALPLKSPDPACVTKALEAVELGDAAHLYPAQLSGGMARRVAIARALAFDGEALLLDEPFNGLETELWGRLCERIRQQYRDRLILLITHRLEEAEALGAAVIPWGSWNK